MPERLLRVDRLTVETRSGIPLIRGLALDIDAGEVIALAGESGAGKTLTGLALMGLLPPALALDPGSSVRWQGRELIGLGERDLRRLRGRELALVPQNPMTALNPVRRVGSQMIHVLKTHRGLDRAPARAVATEALGRLAVPRPERVLDLYPHQLSGGMSQRVLIAMAMACRPKLLIADEVTSALDVTTQAALLDALTGLCRESGTALLLITHDLGIVARSCDRVAVMYCGQIVEQGPVTKVFARPLHPYTAGLMAAVPDLERDPDRPLSAISGQVPEPEDRPAGCAFAPRCPRAQVRCAAQEPQPVEADSRRFRCFHPLV